MNRTYIEFYQNSIGYVPGSHPPRIGKPTPIPVCSDKGVIKVDTGLKLNKVIDIAHEQCEKHGFIGFRVVQGRSLIDVNEIIPLELVK